jgi:hypothetical protein
MANIGVFCQLHLVEAFSAVMVLVNLSGIKKYAWSQKFTNDKPLAFSRLDSFIFELE